MNQNLKTRFMDVLTFTPLVAFVIAVAASLATLGILRAVTRFKSLSKQEFKEMVEEVILDDGPISQAQARALIKSKKRSR